MATIASSKPFAQVGAYTITETALTGADVLEYSSASKQVLFLENTTGAPVNVTIDGADVTTVNLPGQGTTTNNAAGIVIAVPANGTVAVALVLIRNFLKGVVAVTGGTGCNAWVVEM